MNESDHQNSEQICPAPANSVSLVIIQMLTYFCYHSGILFQVDAVVCLFENPQASAGNVRCYELGFCWRTDPVLLPNDHQGLGRDLVQRVSVVEELFGLRVQIIWRAQGSACVVTLG